jgi:hypothetical protein
MLTLHCRTKLEMMSFTFRTGQSLQILPSGPANGVGEFSAVRYQMAHYLLVFHIANTLVGRILFRVTD